MPVGVKIAPSSAASPSERGATVVTALKAEEVFPAEKGSIRPFNKIFHCRDKQVQSDF